MTILCDWCRALRVRHYIKNALLAAAPACSGLLFEQTVLVAPIAAPLGVQLIATEVDPSSGALLTPNCKGEAKLRRLRAHYGEQVRAEAFYSDSLSDIPLARLAERAYLMRGRERRPWPPEP